MGEEAMILTQNERRLCRGCAGVVSVFRICIIYHLFWIVSGGESLTHEKKKSLYCFGSYLGGKV